MTITIVSKLVQDLITPYSIMRHTYPAEAESYLSYLYGNYFCDQEGMIKPPTVNEFRHEYDSIVQPFHFISEGGDIEDHKRCLRYNLFPEFEFSDDRIKVITWTRMVMAFNMYVYVLEAFGLSRNYKVDVIIPVGDISPIVNSWEQKYFNFAAFGVLYVSNSDIIRMIELTGSEESCFQAEFWQHIFDIYKSLYPA